MKGILVPLLVFCATGIVVGQQPSPNLADDWSFNGPSILTPQPDDGPVDEVPVSTETKQEFGQQRTQNALDWLNQANRFELVLDQQQLQALQLGNVVQSEISLVDPTTNQPVSKEIIDAITARDQRVDGRRANVVPIDGIAMEDELGRRVLNFVVNRSEIDSLARSQFMYRVPEADRGKYDIVRIVPEQRSAPDAGTGQSNDFNENGFSAPNVAPDNGFGASPLTPMPQEAFQNVSGQGQVSSFNGDLALPQSGWKIPGSARSGALGGRSSAQPTENELAQARLENQRRELELLEDKKWRLQNDLQRLQRIATEQPQERLADRTGNSLQPPPFGTRREDFNRSVQATPSEYEKLQSTLKLAGTALDREQSMRQQAEAEVDRLKRQLEEANRYNYTGRTQQSRPPYGRNDTGLGPITPVGLEQPVDGSNRVADQRSGEVSSKLPAPNQMDQQVPTKPGKSIPLKSDQNDQEQRSYGALFVMFLLSVGLNCYLAILCRNFYVRYGDLADELRETFTSSV